MPLEKGKHSLLNGFLKKPREKKEKPQEEGAPNAASSIASKTSSSHSTLQVADPPPTPSESLLKVVKDSFHASSLERENHFQSQFEYQKQVFQDAEWERNQDEESRNAVFRQLGVDVQRDWSTKFQEIAKDLDTWQLQSHDASLKQQASRDQIFHHGVEEREKLYKDGFQRRAIDLRESEEKRIQAHTKASEKLKIVRTEVRRTIEVKFKLFLAEERQKYEEDEKRRNNIVKRKFNLDDVDSATDTALSIAINADGEDATRVVQLSTHMDTISTSSHLPAPISIHHTILPTLSSDPSGNPKIKPSEAMASEPSLSSVSVTHSFSDFSSAAIPVIEGNDNHLFLAANISDHLPAITSFRDSYSSPQSTSPFPSSSPTPISTGELTSSDTVGHDDRGYQRQPQSLSERLKVLDASRSSSSFLDTLQDTKSPMNSFQDHILLYESAFVQHQNEHAIQFQSSQELRDSLFRESQSHFDTHLQPNRVNWFRTVRLEYQQTFDTDVKKRSLRAHLFQQRRDRAEDSRQLRFEWEIQQSQHTRFQGQINALSLKLDALNSIKVQVLKKEGEEMDSFLRSLQAEIESTLTRFKGDFSDAQTGRRWQLNLRTLQGGRPAATRTTMASSWADDVDEPDDDFFDAVLILNDSDNDSYDPVAYEIPSYSHIRRRSVLRYESTFRLEPERTMFAPTSLFVNMFSSTTPFFKRSKRSPHSSLNGYKKSPDTAVELVHFLDSCTDRYNSRWREREDAFNTQQEAHKSIHNSNEQKRNQIFTAGMSEFEEMRQTQLSDWTNKVIEVKHGWRELSSKAEENRETKFKEMEIQRAEMFTKSELERSGKWEELIMKLNEAFIEANQDFDEEICKWQSHAEQMFDEEMAQWRRSFSSLQAEFEQTFVEIVQSAKQLAFRQNSDT